MIKQSLHISCYRVILFGCLLTPLVTALELKEVPPPPADELQQRPKNLARQHMGVKTTSSNADLNWDALLSDDPGETLSVPPGNYQVTLDMQDFFFLDQFGLSSSGISGSIQISGSLTEENETSWLPLGEAIELSDEGFQSLAFPMTEIRYIKLDLNIKTGGEIYPIQLSGGPSLAQAIWSPPADDQEITGTPSDTQSFNFASTYAGSQVTHVSSGNLDDVYFMIDDDASSYHAFDPQDSQSTLLLDLRATQKVNRISLILESPPGTLETYHLNALPEGFTSQASGADSDKQGVRSIQLPESFFEENTPDQSYAFDSKSSRLRLDFPAQEMRWLMLRWMPDSNGNAGATLTSESLRIFEIAVIGEVDREFAAVALIPRLEFANPEVNAVGPQITPASPPQSTPTIPFASP